MARIQRATLSTPKELGMLGGIFGFPVYISNPPNASERPFRFNNGMLCVRRGADAHKMLVQSVLEHVKLFMQFPESQPMISCIIHFFCTLRDSKSNLGGEVETCIQHPVALPNSKKSGKQVRVFHHHMHTKS